MIVHDYLTQRGGAERVLLAMGRAFPDAPIYTSVYEPTSTFAEFTELDVRPLWPNRVAALRRNHRKGIAAYPFAFSGLKIDADVIICSSSGFAHGARTDGRKIFYCYTPARWLYDQADAYLAGWSAPVRVAARVLEAPLRAWDVHAARTADVVLTSSSVVRDRIASAYGIDATLLPPPIAANVGPSAPRHAIANVSPGFVLCVARLLSYKNIDAVISAFAALPDAQLVIAGDGPDRERLRGLAGHNVMFVGQVDEPELAWLYANCAGLVAASYEDFGLTPLEAAAHGRPAAVLRGGGFLDTVIEAETGFFFDEVEPREIATKIAALMNRQWDSGRISTHAADFSDHAFARGLLTAVASQPAAEEWSRAAQRRVGSAPRPQWARSA